MDNQINNIETHEIIYKIISVLNVTGMWQKEDDCNIRKFVKKLLIFLVGVTFSLSLLFGAVLNDDRNEAIFLASAGIASVLMNVKLSYVLWKKEEITKFLNGICSHFVARTDELNEINKRLNSFANIGYTAMISMSISISSFVVLSLPVFSAERRLPINVAFPLDWKNSLLFYWLGYTFVITGVVCATITTCFTIVYLYIILNCSIKYQVLAKAFRNMDLSKAITRNDIPVKMQEKLHLQDLIRLIKIHRESHGAIDQFKSCFSSLFSAQIAASNICICFSVYVLTTGSSKNIIQFVINVAVLFYNAFDIFMVLYFGNEVKCSSNELSYRLFESNWIVQSVSYRKCILTLTEVLKKPHELVVLKLYPLDLETFTSISKLTYSMFNILQNFNK